MTYKLHMDGVITGSLSSFCLACDIFLKSQQEATDHIGTSEHKKKSDKVQYSDKFQDEHIKKFKGGYYCKFCNVLMPIASKVNLHITEDEHKHNKGILLLKPMGGDVLAFNNILIEEKAWHGLIDGVCSLCNAEFEDETDHKTDASHSLNLVLKPIQFGADNAIFRHLDDTAVQCLTCNKLLAPGRMTKHFDDTEHHELYAKRRIETNGICQGIDTTENCKGSEAKENCKDKATNLTSAIENDGEIKKPPMDKYAKRHVETNGVCQGIKTKENCEESEDKESCKDKAANMNSARENDGKIKKPTVDNDVNKNSDIKSDKSKILESTARYQSKGMNINLETEKAFCKKCSKVITFDFVEIENHIQNHSSAKAVNSDLLYPSNVDQNLNRVDINDKTTQSPDNKQNTEVVFNIHDRVKAGVDNIQNAVRNAKAASCEENTDSSSSDDEFYLAPKENFEKCSQEEAAREFAKANKITYNGDNNQSFCRICDVHLPASFRCMKEHVEGANHKRLVASSITLAKTPGKQVKESTREFVDSAYDVRGMFYTASIINEEFCILRSSFYFISENSSRMRCIVCEVNLPPYSDIEDHVKTKQHCIKWLGAPVIISEKKEFIREVHPGLYHCGYCHLVVAGWAGMKQHLECSDHRDNRTMGENRMRLHYPGLQRHKMQKDMEAMAMMSLFNMFR